MERWFSARCQGLPGVLREPAKGAKRGEDMSKRVQDQASPCPAIPQPQLSDSFARRQAWQ